MSYSEFNEMLDECYPIVVIAGCEFRPSQILEELDPVAYNCMYNDWSDMMEERKNNVI
jgi:hypothetical protein